MLLDPSLTEYLKLYLFVWYRMLTVATSYHIGREVWSQCAIMVSEIGLDASVYLPALEIPDLKLAKACQGSSLWPCSLHVACWEAVTVPAAPCPEAAGAQRQPDRMDAFKEVLACSVVEQLRLPRPVVASEVEDEGAQRLVGWSRTRATETIHQWPQQAVGGWQPALLGRRLAGASERWAEAQGGEPLLEPESQFHSPETYLIDRDLKPTWPCPCVSTFPKGYIYIC